ncbi:MAG: hypothetical protein AAFX53_11575 [Bacteroidota bacterium]
MAFDPELQKRIEDVLALLPKEISKDMVAKKMFGGVAFLYKGKMTIGIVKQDLMVPAF